MKSAPNVQSVIPVYPCSRIVWRCNFVSFVVLLTVEIAAWKIIKLAFSSTRTQKLKSGVISVVHATASFIWEIVSETKWAITSFKSKNHERLNNNTLRRSGSASASASMLKECSRLIRVCLRRNFSRMK